MTPPPIASLLALLAPPARRVQRLAIAAVALTSTLGFAQAPSSDTPAAPFQRPRTLRPEPGTLHLAHLAAGAELIFAGRVVEIRYAASTPSGGSPSLPHTFVRYQVDEVLHGTHRDPYVTLRFFGGWDPASGRYLRVSGVPQFDLGDRDVLFVAGNGTRRAPLVGQEAGRLRIIDGHAFEESGRALEPDGTAGLLRLGARSLLEDVRTTRIQGTGHVLEAGLGKDLVLGTGSAMSADVLLANVRELCLVTPSPRTVHRDANPALAFVGPDVSPTDQPLARQTPSRAVDPEEAATRARQRAAQQRARKRRAK